MSPQSAWHLVLWVHFLAIALWTGGIFSVASVAAPAVNRSMASKALAVQILSHMLRRLNFLEFMCFFLLIVTTCSGYRFIPEHTQAVWKILFCILVMGAISVYYTFVLTPKLEILKERIPALAQDMPARAEFDRLYRIYVGCLALNEALGLVLLYQSVVIF
jgi:uncharacterized membrane protein